MVVKVNSGAMSDSNTGTIIVILALVSIYIYTSLGGTVIDIIKEVSRSLILVLIAVLLVREFGIKLNKV